MNVVLVRRTVASHDTRDRGVPESVHAIDEERMEKDGAKNGDKTPEEREAEMMAYKNENVEFSINQNGTTGRFSAGTSDATRWENAARASVVTGTKASKCSCDGREAPPKNDLK
jgi:NCAIR mutase (PurE)-related protein